MDDIDLLASSELFSGFDSETLNRLVAGSRGVECDRNVSLFTSTGQFVVTQTPNRPRVLGLTIGYKF